MAEFERHRILFVDDQPTLIGWARVVFGAESDCDLATCSDAKAAAEVARSFRPTVILQDLIMPGQHGLELFSAYRRVPELAEVPVIVLSSVEDVEEKARAFQLGVADYVVKMPDPIELAARVRAHSRAFLNDRALAATRDELNLTFENAPIGMALVSLEGRWLRVNDALCQMLGYTREQMLATDFQRVTHPDDLDADLELVRQLLHGVRQTYQLPKRYYHRDGRVVSVLLSVALVRAEDGAPRFFVSQVVDMTARIEAERDAVRQSSITRAVIDSMQDAVMVADADGNVTLLNRTAEGMFASAVKDGIPKQWPEGAGLFLTDKVTRCPPEQDPLFRALRGESVQEMVLWMKMPDWPEGQWHSVTGSPVRDREGNLVGAVNVGRDITARKNAEDAFKLESQRDPLTGVLNRRSFNELCELQLELADRNGSALFAMFIDLDDMKGINDRGGHEAGDAALKAAAALLRGSCRSSDIVGRLGGDEFAILAAGEETAAHVLRDRIQAAVVKHGGLSLSIGIALRAAFEHRTLVELLAKADQSMYERKRRRRSQAT